MGLDDGTPYQYQIQAFDMANNLSDMSNTLPLTTALNTPPNAPTLVSATAVSPKQITITWSSPQNASGLSKYLIYAGTAPSTLVQVATMPSTSTSYNHQPLEASTTYYYGVIAVEQSLNSPMSPVLHATTLPLPNPPVNVVATATSPTKITLTWQEQIPANGLQIAKAAIDAYDPNIGIGVGGTFAHIDVRGVAQAWNYGGATRAWVASPPSPPKLGLPVPATVGSW
jgi:fibronectin type 3 domain-containing protein